MASRIDTLISKCRSWDEFVELVNALPKTKNKEKGDLFERLTQVYLQTQPTYRSKLKNVYLLSDKTIPERLRTKLNLPDNDEGIDLVCETYSGEYWSVQCKYKSDQSAALTYKELSTFNSLSFNACKGISLGLVAHTSTKPVKKSHLMPMVNEIGLEKWLEISDADWKQITSVCRSNRLKPPKKRNPKRHQKAAIADAHNHFVTKKQKRGKLIMPCGTGKSLTAYWIAQALEAKTIVVAVPSLALVRQSLADWTAEYLAEGITPEWLAVCSDHSVGSMGDADSTVATAYEMGIPTNPTDEELDNFLKKRSKAPKVVFTTYQSAEKLCDASRRNNKTFDLLIADEAHKTVGRKSKSFATLLFDENIKVKRRLFMTATERVYNASRDDVVSMDDPDIYGSTYHQLSFKEAIKQKIICDYKIVTIAVSDTEINALIQEKTELSVSAGNKTIETDAHSLAAGIAMQKAFEKYGIKHAVTFHSSIRRAESFKGQQEDLPNNTHVSHSHISSKLSAGQRAKLLKGFAEEERSLVTNARCLTEGVDIKAIDCVAFVDPKQSTIDIVQAAGRAMRQSPATDKKFGYILLPIIISEGDHLDELGKSATFKPIIKVITSLSTQDERIVEELRNLSENKKKNTRNLIDFDEGVEQLLNVELEKLKESLKLVIWQKVGQANYLSFDEAKEKIQMFSLKSESEWRNLRHLGQKPADIPSAPESVYVKHGWSGYPDFLGYTSRIAEYVKFEDARAFARTLRLKSRTEWHHYARTIGLPKGIPLYFAQNYKDQGFVGVADFLGTDYVHANERTYWPFEKARKYVRSLGLRNQTDWTNYLKSKDRNLNIHSRPAKQYKNDWVGLHDWLGTDYIATKKREYLEFEKCREIVVTFGLKSYDEWREFCKTGQKPKDIPTAANRIYKNKGWISWAHFLGQKRKSNWEKSQSFASFQKARKITRSHKLSSGEKYRGFLKDNPQITNLPTHPNRVYRGKGWAGWGDWLGTGRVATRERNYWNFQKARQYARSLNLNSMQEWVDLWDAGKTTKFIMRNPETSKTYKSDWKGAEDFLGYKKRTKRS